MRLKTKNIIIIFLILFGILVFRIFIKDNIIRIILLFVWLSLTFVLILFLVVNKIKTDKKSLFFKVLFTALILKILSMLVLHNLFLFPDELSAYDNFAWLQTQDWLGGPSFDLYKEPKVGGAFAYYYFISAVYLLLGHDILIAKLFNIFLSLTTAIFLFLLTKDIFSERTAIFSFVGFLFFPSINLYTLPLLRESFVIFLIITIFFFLTKLIEKFNFLQLLLFSLLFLLMIINRVYISVILGLVGLLYCSYNIIFCRNKKAGYLLPIIIVLIFASLNYISLEIPAPGSVFNETKSKKMIESPSFLEKITNLLDYQRKISSYGRTTFKREVTYESFANIVSYFPYGAVYFVLSPLPSLSVKGMFTMFLVELLYFVVLPFAAYGVFLSFKKLHRTIHLMLFLIFTSVLYILIEANVGTLLRHRIQVVPVLIIFAAYGLSQFISRLSKKNLSSND